MERIRRQPYNFSENFSGNWDLFQNVLKNRETVFVYDNDGIFSDTSKEVYKRFGKVHGLNAKPEDITEWNYLTRVAEAAGLNENVIKHAEDGFYDPMVLGVAPAVYGIRRVISRTMDYYGRQRNYILTSRNPEFKATTVDWFRRKFPEFLPENIIIRETKNISGEDFKVEKLRLLASKNPWVVFVDDGQQFIRRTLEADIKNCLVVNIPVGKVEPKFVHERFFVFRRYPVDLQAVYPFYDAVDRALDSHGV